METKIYLVMWNVDYDGSYVGSCHRTKKGARKEANRLAQKCGYERTVGCDEWRKTGESITIEDHTLLN